MIQKERIEEYIQVLLSNHTKNKNPESKMQKDLLSLS